MSGIKEIESAVLAGERLHETATWPTAAMRDDSWRNRRIAIVLSGLGDIAVRMGRWPADRHCVLVLAGLLRSIRRIAVDCSRELAHSIAMLPALHEHDPAPKLGTAAQPAWRARWAHALDAVGTRHRNLLAMSPAAILPTGGCFDRHSLELLPLLEHADAWCLPPVSLLGSLNSNEYRELHRRSWAVLQRRNGRRLVAEQV